MISTHLKTHHSTVGRLNIKKRKYRHNTSFLVAACKRSGEGGMGMVKEGWGGDQRAKFAFYETKTENYLFHDPRPLIPEILRN